MAKRKQNVRGPFKITGRNSYYVEVERKRRSLKTSDLERAKSLVAKVKAKLTRKPVKPRSADSALTFDKFMVKYLKWAERTQPIKTFKANRLALRKLAPFCGGMVLPDIGPYHLDQMVAENMENGLKPNSVNCYIRHAKSVFGQAVKWGFLREHPFKKCKVQRVAKRPPKALDGDDIKALFAVIDDCYDEMVIRAYLSTGRSRAELVSLRWEDVDLARGRYYITRTKTHLSKWYPLGTAFRKVLESLGPHESGLVFWRGYHPDTITHKVKKYMVKAGIDGHSLHHLRHSFARLYLEADGSIYALQQLLGHSQVSTTQIYSSMSTGKLGAEIERVSI